MKFDAAAWVALAKQAGMKYIVITSKHHDGFAMFDTKLTDWGIMSTPFHRDPIKELAAACKKAGLKFCVYYSIMDWHHPDYPPRRPWNDTARGTPDMDRYVKFMKGQLKELVTNYGPLGILWFDGEWEPTWTQERGRDLYAYVRGLQPDIIINNRVGKNRKHGIEGLERGRRDRRRLRHARAADSRQRAAAGRRLGIVHDDERPLGVQQERPKLEIVDQTDPHVDRHRVERGQLPAERRPDLRRA